MQFADFKQKDQLFVMLSLYIALSKMFLHKQIHQLLFFSISLPKIFSIVSLAIKIIKLQLLHKLLQELLLLSILDL